MNVWRRLVALIGSLAAAALNAAPPAPQPGMAVERFGALVLAEDLERSAAFYARLFGRQPQVRTPTLVGFDVAGGLFAVAARAAYAPEAHPGGAVRPYLKVRDLASAYAHVRAVAPESLRTSVVEEGAFSFFRLADPEGNVVELFAMAARP